MNKFKIMLHVNNNPGTNYISECGEYVIDESRKGIVWQNGYPVISMNFEGIPDNVQWKIK